MQQLISYCKRFIPHPAKFVIPYPTTNSRLIPYPAKKKTPYPASRHILPSRIPPLILGLSRIPPRKKPVSRVPPNPDTPPHTRVRGIFVIL